MTSQQTPADSRHSETVLAIVRGAAAMEHIDSILSRFGLRAETSAGSDRIAVMSGNRHSEPEVDRDLVELALEKLGDSVPSLTVVDSKLRQL